MTSKKSRCRHRNRRSRIIRRRGGGAEGFSRRSCKDTFDRKNKGSDYSKSRYSACKYAYPFLYREQDDPYNQGKKKRHFDWLLRKVHGKKKLTKEELRKISQQAPSISEESIAIASSSLNPDNSKIQQNLPGSQSFHPNDYPDNTQPNDYPDNSQSQFSDQPESKYSTPTQYSTPSSGVQTPRDSASRWAKLTQETLDDALKAAKLKGGSRRLLKPQTKSKSRSKSRSKTKLQRDRRRS